MPPTGTSSLCRKVVSLSRKRLRRTGLPSTDPESNASFYQTWNEPLTYPSLQRSSTRRAVRLPSDVSRRPTPKRTCWALPIHVREPSSPTLRSIFSSVSGTTSIVLSFTIDGGRRFGGISFQVERLDRRADGCGRRSLTSVSRRVGLDDEMFRRIRSAARESATCLCFASRARLQVNGSTEQLELLGFAQSQTNSGSPTALGQLLDYDHANLRRVNGRS